MRRTPLLLLPTVLSPACAKAQEAPASSQAAPRTEIDERLAAIAESYR